MTRTAVEFMKRPRGPQPGPHVKKYKEKTEPERDPMCRTCNWSPHRVSGCPKRGGASSSGAFTCKNGHDLRVSGRYAARTDRTVGRCRACGREGQKRYQDRGRALWTGKE